MDIRNKVSEKNVKPVGIILLFIISTVLLLYVSYFSVFPVMELFGIIAFGAFCAAYSVLLRHGSFWLCVLAPGVSVAVITFIYAPTGLFDTEAVLCYINLISAVVISAVANACSVKKSSFGASFVTLSVAVSVYICTVLLVVVYDAYKSISLDILKKAVNDAAAFAGSIFSDTASVISSETGAELPEQYKKMLSEYGKQIGLTFKLTFPSMIATSAMAVAAFVNIFSKVFAKTSGMVNAYLGERETEFNLSAVSAICFELVYFVYIIILLFSGNTMLQAAFLNLVSVLTVPFAYIGLRHLVRLLAKRFNSKAAAIAVTASATVCLIMLFSSSILILAALIGASSINKITLDKMSE